MDSVTPASPTDSNEPTNVLEKFEQFALEHPNAIEYQLTGELEAATILTALVALLRGMMVDIHHTLDKAQTRARCNAWQTAIIQGRALDVFRKQTPANQITLSGIKITAAKRWEH